MVDILTRLFILAQHQYLSESDRNRVSKRPDANVQARIIEDTRLREASEAMALDRRLDAWAVWQGNNKAYHHKQETNRKQAIAQELQCANQELLLVRRANLRDLLESEHAKLERELNDMGLAIVRNDLH